MCTRPITKDEYTFACRTCDECLSVRRSGWVARAMAEKAMHAHTLCIALTYGNDTQARRDAAAMFCYADVRAFLARLRSALRRKYGDYTLRFICAGEQGSRNGRCHWHLILYSDRDLTTVGDFSLRGRTVTDRASMMTVGKRKRRLDWSIWGEGFVTLQEPDEGGMSYVLSYCLKDQFIGEKSHGTMREARSENFATGLFRMSKRPPIGESWLMRKMEALDAKGAVLPSLQITIPDMAGYWHPNGRFRETLLWCLVALNQRVVWSTGANAPQWAALVASCQDNEKDMEILHGIPTPPEEQPGNPDFQSFAGSIAARGRQDAGENELRQHARRCGSALPCWDCLNCLTDQELAENGVTRIWPEDGSAWQYAARPGHRPVEERQRTSGERLNPLCQVKGSKLSRLVFPASDPLGPLGYS